MSRSGAAALLSLALASGCAPGPAAPGGGTLTLAVRSDVTGVYPNPPIQSEAFTIDVASNVFEGLVRFDRSFKPQPALAVTWESPDERTWVFRLRRSARFSDGTPVVSADVVASIRAALTRGYVTAPFLSDLEEVATQGDDAVRIRTRHPSPVLLSHIPFGFVLPARALEQRPVPPIGTGPYTVQRWEPGSELVLARNPHYLDGPVPFERVRFVVTPSAADRVAALRSGKADVIDDLPTAEADRLRSDPRVRVETRPGFRVLFLAFRMDRPPFSDPRVREAVDLAIDRAELIERALPGRGVPASSLVPPSIVGFDAEVPPARLDRERARGLLREAGFPHGLDVRLDGTRDRYANDAEVLAEAARQLATVGVRVEVNALPKSQFFPLLDGGGSDFYLLGWACDTVHAGMALDALMHSRSGGGLGSQNTQRLSDPELDRRIDAAREAAELSVRARLLAGALARVAELRPIVPLHVQVESIAFSRRLDWEPPLNLALRLHEVRLAPPR